MKLYKVTTAKGVSGTRFPCIAKVYWKAGVTKELTPRPDPRLCTSTVYHAYVHPIQAVLADSLLHLNYLLAGQLWEAEGEPVIWDCRKVGCFKLTTIRPIETPSVSGTLLLFIFRELNTLRPALTLPPESAITASYLFLSDFDSISPCELQEAYDIAWRKWKKTEEKNELDA